MTAKADSSKSRSHSVNDWRTRERRKGDCVHPYDADEPTGYIGWHDWAERKAKTHDQAQCPECGLWVFWVPKSPSVQGSGSVDSEPSTSGTGATANRTGPEPSEGAR